MQVTSFALSRPNSLRFLFDPQWWKTAVRLSLDFAPRCASCAIGLTVANVLVVLGSFLVQSRLKSVEVMTMAEIAGLLAIGIGSLLIILVALIISLWALSVWLMRLTAFARAVVTAFQAQTASPGNLPVEASKLNFNQAIDETKLRRGYITRLWIFASLYLLLPVVPLTVLIALHMVASGDYTVAGAAPSALPANIPPVLVKNGTVVLASLFSIVTVAYSLATIVLSAASDLPPFKLATDSLAQVFKFAVPLLTIATVVSLINVIVSAPYMLLTFTGIPDLVRHDPMLGSAAQIWMGLTSAFLWPLSLLPFCQIVAVQQPEGGADG